MPFWAVLCAAALAAPAAPLTWREVVRADTSIAYRTYAAQNVGTAKGEVAAKRAEDRAWSEAQTANTSAAYRSFVQAYPSARNVAEAHEREVVLAWEEASAGNTIEALSTYLGRYPTSVHAPEARARVEEMWFQAAQAEATEAAWARFLVQYPQGSHTAVAWAERDRLAWDRAVHEGTRASYRRYVDEIPTLTDVDGTTVAGAHRAEAVAWVADTYVRQIEPLVALIETWQPASARPAALDALGKTIERELLPVLRQTFTVLPLRAVDATNGMLSPQEIVGIKPDTGVLVFEVHEKGGRPFDPDGRATDLEVVLRLYTPNSPNAVMVRQVTATTPDRVRGTAVGELYAAAVHELGTRLRGAAMELTAQAPR